MAMLPTRGSAVDDKNRIRYIQSARGERVTHESDLLLLPIWLRPVPADSQDGNASDLDSGELGWSLVFISTIKSVSKVVSSSGFMTKLTILEKINCN